MCSRAPSPATSSPTWGADVIKVEARQGGDLARQLGADQELNEADMGVSFLAQNPGKRSITLNLKHPKGKEALRRLVRTAQVLVENYRPRRDAAPGPGLRGAPEGEPAADLLRHLRFRAGRPAARPARL